MAYAVFKTGGKQYRVAAGDVIDVERLAVEPGAEIIFSEVLLIADDSGINLGGGKVRAEVVEERKAPKVIAFKYRRRKGYHRTVGHRRRLTRLKIKAIES